ncbi:MAG: hypothetical protein ACXW2S_03140 [Telluria sp.]
MAILQRIGATLRNARINYFGQVFAPSRIGWRSIVERHFRHVLAINARCLLRIDVKGWRSRGGEMGGAVVRVSAHARNRGANFWPACAFTTQEVLKPFPFELLLARV